MLRISNMSGKLEGIQALNTDTTSNSFCKRMSKAKDTICASCYSWKMLTTYRKNCIPAFRHNTKMLSKPLPNWAIPNTPPGVFRIHAHGEFTSSIHFENVMRIVVCNVQTFFGIWTKRKDYVQAWLSVYVKPRNCSFIYSNPRVDTSVALPSGFNKVFNVWSNNNKRINCNSKCVKCLLCYTSNRVTQIHEVIK